MRPCIYYQMIVTMSRRMNFVIGVFSFILFYATSMLAQSDKAVFHIQVFKNDSTILREGTGFFIDGNHGFSYALLFKNGAFAQVITKDSSVHKINKINGFDVNTDVVRLELDNMLSAKITNLKSANEMSPEGSSIKIIFSEGIQSTRSISKKISKKAEFIGYGSALLLNGKLDEPLFGSPVLNSKGEVEGIVVPLKESGASGFVSNMSTVTNLRSVSKSVSEFGNGLKIQNSLIQGIDAYMADDTKTAISAFGKAKSAMPKHVTAFYYSGLINFAENRISAARSDMNKAIELDNSLSRAYLIRGIINYNNDDFNNAIHDFDKAESLKNSELQLFELRGKAKYNSKNYEGAITDLIKAESLDSKDAEV
ncbi:MAG: hypothetical protein KAI29_29065, partial [Cyclobacteriaceae bacterium]|nr:hypothetical protein [Cyclobacteriaceae bacterium]